MSNNQIKIILSAIALVLVYPIRPFRILVDGTRFFLRSIYTQWIRCKLNSSPLNITISYPIELRGGENIDCGNNVFFGPNINLSTWDSYKEKKYTPHILIGNNVTIGGFAHISCVNKISIGNHVLIGQNVTLIDNGHGDVTRDNMELDPKQRVLSVCSPLLVEDNVWIGDKVTIIGGVTIGRGAIIGSNSVVTKDIPPYSVAVGVPAKVIRQL